MTDTPLDDLDAVLAAVEGLVDGVRADQWALPTPCAEWDVRDLVSHFIRGNRLFAGILAGGASPTADPATGDARDDPVAAYREAAAALLAAFRRPGAMEQVVRVPAGEMPGAAALHLRIVEGLAHGWDIARATGQQLELPARIAEAELAFTQRRLAGVPPGRSPFGPPQPAPDDAPAIDRLVALLGRSVATG